MKKIPTHEEIVNDVLVFLAKTGMKAHEFGKKYLNDSGAVSRLKKGSDPRLSTVRKIYQALKGK